MKLRVVLVGCAFGLVALLACKGSEDARDPSSAGGSSSGGMVDAESSSSSGAAVRDAATNATSSSSSSSSSSTSSSSGELDRCAAAAQRVEQKYTECEVSFTVLDAGAPECTTDRAEQNEALAECLEPISCAALRGDADATDRDAYYACLGM